jgi:hypothetical protein
MIEPTVNSIFREYDSAYRKKFIRPSLQEEKVIRSLKLCRTEELGGRLEECEHCGYRVILYNSCRNRHCPQCQNMKKEQWIQERKKEVLPFTYFHVVFTLPDELIGIVWKNKGILYNLMFHTARETLLSVSSEEKYLGADIGFFAILHTWGQKLNPHPHLHCVVPGGGFSQKKQKWIHAPNNYLFPVEVVKKRFRSLFLQKLKKLYRTHALFLEGTPWKDCSSFQRLIDTLFAKDWVVYLKESFQNRDSVIEYLARYTHRIAISNHRIISIDNDMVNFSYRDYKEGNSVKTAWIPAVSFMRRFLLHVLPYRFVRIRYYGILSHRNKKKAIEACRKFYNLEQIHEEEPLDWRDFYQRVTGKDVSLCPLCKTGVLCINEIIPARRYRAPPTPDDLFTNNEIIQCHEKSS